MMNNQELQELVESISLEFFNMPFQHKAVFNHRLKTTGGRYLLKSHNLEFNLNSFKHYGLDELIGIIKHELCHYHLRLQGKRYSHRDTEFKECLHRVQGSRYSKPLSTKREKPYIYKLICKNCGQEYLRKRKLNPNFYRCGKCKGELILEYIKGPTMFQKNL